MAEDPARPRALPPSEPIAERYGLPSLWGRRGVWQIRLRWSVAPVMIAGVVVGRLLGFEFPVVPVLAIALASPLYNGLFALLFRRYRERIESDPRLDRLLTQTEVAVDYVAVFLLMYFTGGASSPLVVLLIFHVIIAAIQFSAANAYRLAGVAVGGLWFFLLGQVGGWLPCHAIYFRGEPLVDMARPSYTAVMVVFYSATLLVTAGMVSLIMHRLRERVGALGKVTVEREMLMRERRQFTLEVAHNLRAPLAASLSIVDLLNEGYVGEMSAPQRQHLARLEARLKTMNQAIGELLTIARTRDKTLEMQPVVIDLGFLARQTEELFRGEAQRRQLDLEVVAGEDLPQVESGRGVLERVLENLVSNALKYTPAGGRVEVRFERDDGQVRITVRDNGIGIPAEEQAKLFRQFFRASNARRTSADGTGLGLVLVRQSLERYGGTIDLTSEVGEGTTVLVRLPVEGAPASG